MKPMVDLKTGKIYGCKKGSKEYLHEEGHLIFQDKFTELILGKEKIDELWKGIVCLSLIFYFIYDVMGYIFGVNALIFYIIYMGIDMFEEKWCNNYAMKSS